MLSQATAQKIVATVKADAESVRRIDSWVKKVVPDHWGAAGGIRNLGYLLSFQDPSDPSVAAKVCYGIAMATSSRIEASKGHIREIRRAGLADRAHRGVEHVGTLVEMHDGTTYVFDWHATLNADDPLISRVQDWKEDRNSVLYSQFRGLQ
jgi:hypothetical protein